MSSECAAVGWSEKLTKDSEFSFHAFSFKNEARKWQWQMAVNQWDLAIKKLWEPKHHNVLCSKHFENNNNNKTLHRSHTAEHSVSVQIQLTDFEKFPVQISKDEAPFCRGVHRVVNLDKFPVQISKDEALMPLPVVGPLFISPLLFHLSQALSGAWRFGLFRCVYSSFHNRLDLIRLPAFYWVFYFIFPIYPYLFHHDYVKMKSFVCSSSID